jgi:hypothetical protein
VSTPTGSREELEKLEEEELAVSARRRRLHDRIDFLRGSGEPDVEERLARLTTEERAISDRRLELHRLIDALRVELGIGAPGPPPKDSIRDR